MGQGRGISESSDSAALASFSGLQSGENLIIYKHFIAILRVVLFNYGDGREFSLETCNEFALNSFFFSER